MKKISKRHGPKELPFLGSGMRFGKDPLKFMDELHAEFGDAAQYKLLGSEFVAVFSPKLVDQILTKNANNYVKSVFMRERWKPFFGRGVIVSEGEDWKSARKALQPFMNRDKLSRYYEVMLEQTQKYADTVKDGQAINISRDMMQLMLVSLMKILFHSELDDKKIARFGHLFDECVNYFAYTLQPAGIMFHALPTPAKKKFQKTIAELDELIDEMLNMHNDPSAVNMFSALKQAKDENGKPLSNKLIRDNVLNFFIAGHETSSLSICYTMFLLATHPVHLKEVQAELDSVLQGKVPHFTDLENLKKTRNAVNEAMRLFPPAGIIGREALEADELGDISIEKGTNIIIPVYSIHRSPKIFEQALEFKPERWDSFDFVARKNEFLPFGVGPRVCMGANFAMMEIVTVLAMLLQKFDLKLLSKPELQLVSSITMRPSEDIILEVRKR